MKHNCKNILESPLNTSANGFPIVSSESPKTMKNAYNDHRIIMISIKETKLIVPLG